MSTDYQAFSSWFDLSATDLLGILLCAALESAKNGGISKTWNTLLLELSKTAPPSALNSSDIKSNERKFDSSTLYANISQVLSTLGVPTNLLGYEYLRQAIFIAVQDRNSLCGITKILYPAVAKKYQVSASSVERAMRHAIEVCCSRGDPDIIEDFFGNTMNPNSGKPTNSEFISKVADAICMDCNIMHTNP